MPQNRPRILWQTAPFDDEGFAARIGKIVGGKWIWHVEFADGRPDLLPQDRLSASFHSFEDAVSAAARAARDQRLDKPRNRF